MLTLAKFAVRVSCYIAVLSLGLFGQPALAQIAPGVTQSAAHTATITGTVATSGGKPVAAADVKLSGAVAILTTRTDANGVFTFTSVPWGTYTISASSSLGLATRSGITLNGDINVSIQYLPPSGLQTIAHVSTTNVGAHINVTPASVYSISPSEYALQGNTSWMQLLNRVPGVSVNGDLQGGAQVDDAFPGNIIQPQVISINGALPYETSVTLDGMPLVSQTEGANPGMGYDLSNLPMAIFPQADIVRGPGADAPSIVDSIGGSFVLHPPGIVEQNRVEYSVSNDMYGGIVSDLAVAQRLGRLSVTATYGVNDSPGPLGSTSIINSYSWLSGFGAIIPNFAFAPETIDGLTFHGCASTGLCGGSLQCTQIPGEGHVNYGPNNDCGWQDDFLFGNVPLSTQQSQHHGALALSYDIAPGVTAGIFYAGTRGQMETPFTEFLTYFSPPAGYSGTLTPGYHDLVASQPLENVQGASLLEEKVTAFIGPGVLRLSAVQNYTFNTSTSVNGTQEPSPRQYSVYGVLCLGGATGVSGCPFGGAPTTFNGSSANFVFPADWTTYIQTSRNRDWVASYTSQIGPSATAGVSYAYSYYNNPQVENGYCPGPTLLADIDSANSSTLSEVRFNTSAQLTDSLSLNASWYFAQGSFHLQHSGYIPSPAAPWSDEQFPYNAPRVGLAWRANQNLVVRAAAGGGFALPPLSDLLGYNASPLSCFAGSCTEQLVNYNLRPETSFGVDVGTDIRLQRDTTLSFDLYRTNLYGQFFTTAQFSTYQGQPLIITQYNNLQQSRYEGMNFSIQRQPLAGWYWQAALGLTRAYVASLPSGFYNDASCPTTPCTNVDLLTGENYVGSFTEVAQAPEPYANGAATIGYRWKPRAFVDLAPTYYGKNNAYFEPAFMEFDSHASYPIGRDLSLFVTFRNMTGIHDAEYQILGVPAVAAPTVPNNDPYRLVPIPYGPRALIFTLQYDGP